MRFALNIILALFCICTYCASQADTTTKITSESEAINNNVSKQPIKNNSPNNKALTELIAKFTSIQSIKAEFVQKSLVNIKKSKVETGVFFFKRPDYITWKTTSPYKQEIFANSNQTITIDPDFKQVVIHTTNLDALYFYLFNADADKLDKLYFISTSVKSKETLYHLVPKQKNELFEKIDLIFVNNQLHKIQWEDSLGKNVVINLNKVKTNLTLKDDLFAVDIKKLEKSGYDIADYQDKKNQTTKL